MNPLGFPRHVAVFFVALLLFAAGHVHSISWAETRCPDLKGDALQKCLQGEHDRGGPPTILFLGPDGKEQKLDTAAVTRSIETVCKETKQDGIYTAYRSGQDRARNRIWKQVECRSGHVEGLWKEYFPEDDMTIVLYYDTAGNSVKQALYIGGKLIREQPISSSRKNTR
jgi:hypothetical protein